MRTFANARAHGAIFAAAALVACSKLDGQADPNNPDLGIDASFTDVRIDAPFNDAIVTDGSVPPIPDGNCTGSDCCGNGVVDPAETCDTAIVAGFPGACVKEKSACDDGDACTVDDVGGSACTAACTHTAITLCANGDGCCPSGCNVGNDEECSASCGDGVLSQAELCDTAIPAGSPGACPASDGCVADGVCATVAFSGDLCTAACVPGVLDTALQCVSDGCCLADCGASDPDCPQPVDAGAGDGGDEAGDAGEGGTASDAGDAGSFDPGCVDLARLATATSSGGSTGVNDTNALNNGLAGCDYHWVTSTSTPGSAFVELDFPWSVTIASVHISTVSSTDADGGASAFACGFEPGRTLESGILKRFDAGTNAWVIVGAFASNTSDGVDVSLKNGTSVEPVQLDKLRIESIAANNSNAVIREIYAFPKLGCTAP